MSDDTKKTSFTEKATTFAAITAGVVAGAAVIPQNKIPNLWESIKGIFQQNWLRLEEAAKNFRPIAFAWGAKLWSFIKWWTLLSFALVIAGIEVKTRGSNFGHVLVAAGTVSFAGLGILLFTLTDGIAGVLYMKLKIAGSVFGKVTSLVGVDLPELIDVDDLKAFREKVRLVLAGATVLCFSLLFTMFFPAWSTLGWTMCFWALVGVALCAALYLDMKMGKAVKVVFYVTIALIVGMFVIFVLDRLTGGALGFDGFRKWLLKINRSEVLGVFLILVPATLLLMGVFTKDKERKVAFVFAAKWVGIGCVLVGAFLLYRGTMSWQQLSGKDTADDPVGKTVDVAKQKYMGVINDWEEGGSKSAPDSPPKETSSNGGQYMAPPSGGAAEGPLVDPFSSKPVRAATKRRASKPLPKEEPKKYSNLTQGIDELEALGY